MGFFKRFGGAVLAALDFNIERWWLEYLIALALLAFLSSAGYALFLAPPAGAPAGGVVSIPEGATLGEVAGDLANERVIAHPVEFTLLVRAVGGAKSIKAGSYRFAAPENLVYVAWRLLAGDTELAPLRIRFPEGSTVRDMGAIVAAAIPIIAPGDFIAAAGPYEGYLFPDTYRILPTATPESITAMLRSTFDTRIASIAPQIAASGHSLSDIVIMASLVEKEANTAQDKRVIAGILWNRIKLGMPLQVDAVFGYIYGRDTYSPSLEDLATDSPYNTYEHKGLPPGPIGNPGLDSLAAAADPAKTDYLYYLTGTDGVMHYATTFAEHQANRKKYLD